MEKAPTGDIPRVVVATLKELKSEAPDAYSLFQQYGRLASAIGCDWSKTLGDLFLRMLKMVSIPLIITSLLSGVTGLGQADRLGKMFGRTLLYYNFDQFAGNRHRPLDGQSPSSRRDRR